MAEFQIPTESRSLPEVIAALNRVLARIETRMRALQGLDGQTISLHGPVVTNGNAVQVTASDAGTLVTRGDAQKRGLYLSSGSGAHKSDRPVEVPAVRLTRKGTRGDEAVRKDQFRGEVERVVGTAVLSDVVPLEVETTPLAGTGPKASREDHVHGGVNLSDAQTKAGVLTLSSPPNLPSGTFANVATTSALSLTPTGARTVTFPDASGTVVYLAGQLGGTGAVPDVRGVRETGGPTLLTMAAVPDGTLFRRSGATVIGLAASAAYTPSNVTTDRSYDANATSIDEIADVLGTLIADLQTGGILG